eukprot:scaffold24943_cov61-Phaeocystis_antarctica.AAC.1
MGQVVVAVAHLVDGAVGAGAGAAEAADVVLVAVGAWLAAVGEVLRLVVVDNVLEGALAVLAHVALDLDVRAAVGVAVALAARAAEARQRRAVVVEVAHLVLRSVGARARAAEAADARRVDRLDVLAALLTHVGRRGGRRPRVDVVDARRRGVRGRGRRVHDVDGGRRAGDGADGLVGGGARRADNALARPLALVLVDGLGVPHATEAVEGLAVDAVVAHGEDASVGAEAVAAPAARRRVLLVVDVDEGAEARLALAHAAAHLLVRPRALALAVGARGAAEARERRVGATQVDVTRLEDLAVRARAVATEGADVVGVLGDDVLRAARARRRRRRGVVHAGRRGVGGRRRVGGRHDEVRGGAGDVDVDGLGVALPDRDRDGERGSGGLRQRVVARGPRLLDVVPGAADLLLGHGGSPAKERGEDRGGVVVVLHTVAQAVDGGDGDGRHVRALEGEHGPAALGARGDNELGGVARAVGDGDAEEVRVGRRRVPGLAGRRARALCELAVAPARRQGPGRRRARRARRCAVRSGGRGGGRGVVAGGGRGRVGAGARGADDTHARPRAGLLVEHARRAADARQRPAVVVVVARLVELAVGAGAVAAPAAGVGGVLRDDVLVGAVAVAADVAVDLDVGPRAVVLVDPTRRAAEAS